MEFHPVSKLQDGRYFVSPTIDHHETIKECTVSRSVDGELTLSLVAPSQFSAFDEAVVDAAVKNSQAWFNREIPRDTLAQYYQYSLESNALQVNYDKTLVIFDDKKRVLPLTDLSDGTVTTALVKFEGLWFLKRTFGPVWKVLQVRVKKAKPQPPPCLLNDSDSDGN